MATPMSQNLLNLANEIGGKIKALSSSLGLKLSASDAEATYLKKTGKAASATTADTATNAINDADGNNISTTYAKAASLGDLAEKDTVGADEMASEIKLGRLV